MIGHEIARPGGGGMSVKMESEEYLSAVFTGEDLLLGSEPAMDPYPFYPVLDGVSDMCVGKGDGCEVCEPGCGAEEELCPFSAQLPLLDWTDVQSQLGEANEDAMPCVNINQIFDLNAIKTEPNVVVQHMDNVIRDCMWSSSSALRAQLNSEPAPVKIEDDFSNIYPRLKIDQDVEREYSRPETPQTDSESMGTDSDDVIQRVPHDRSVKSESASSKSDLSSGRSLLKRNQFLKVIRAPHRAEQKPALPSPPMEASYAGDHSYSAATTCIGILTPSPSPSESSSEDDNVDSRPTPARQRVQVDSHALSERLHGRPLKARSKHSRGGHKFRVDRSRLHSDDELPPPERRNNHNNMERMRRDMLRGALHTLRRLVPDTAANDKAPKITVLREAAKYCIHLRSRDEALNKQKRRLEEQRNALQRRLELLQRGLHH